MSTALAFPALVIRVGGVSCAIPGTYVVETMRPLPVTPLDDMPPFMRGVATIRGEATPVVDLGALLGQPHADRLRFVTIRLASRCVALAIDEVVGLVPFEIEAFTSRPSLLSASAHPVVQSLAVKDSALHLVLDAARLIDHGDPLR